MRISRLEIQGFRSFAELQSLDLSAMAPGLYHVRGSNLVEPELEGNGAGKSSLFEALYWLAFGRTSRGLRAGAVKNWTSSESCAGILDFETSSGKHSLLRTWSPNALELSTGGAEPYPLEQEEAERIFGFNPDAFLYACYFAQFVPSFADLKAAAQAELFSSILNLEVWEQASVAARDRVSSIALLLQETDESLARLEGQAEEVLSLDFEREEKAWGKAQKKTIAEHERALRTANLRLKTAQTASRQLQARVSALQALEEQARALQRELAQQQANHGALEAGLARLKKQDISKCPECGAPLSREHIKKEIKKKERELASALAAAQKASLKMEPLLLELETAREIEHDRRAGELEERNAERASAAAQALLNAELKRTNPFAQQRKTAVAKGERIAAEIEALQAERAEIEKAKGLAEYWTKGFKDLRLSLIRESLAQLTLEANEALVQLGLMDWSIEFDVERETKGGGINKNFSIMVRAPHAPEAVPWEAWSGGESQRLRLSVAMGLSNLICARAGVTPNLEMWDEPSSWMSAAGIGDLLEVLAERAERQGKIVLLADHRVLDFGRFAGHIEIEKTKEGSRILT